MKNLKRCCICKNLYEGYGNNAAPLKDGLCCDSCNMKVIAARAMVAKAAAGRRQKATQAVTG